MRRHSRPFPPLIKAKRVTAAKCTAGHKNVLAKDQ